MPQTLLFLAEIQGHVVYCAQVTCRERSGNGYVERIKSNIKRKRYTKKFTLTKIVQIHANYVISHRPVLRQSL
jgi:hypothetical protein